MPLIFSGMDGSFCVSGGSSANDGLTSFSAIIRVIQIIIGFDIIVGPLGFLVEFQVL